MDTEGVRMAETKTNIYEAVTRCMEDIGAVGKDDVNRQQGFKYRGIDAVMNAINPALVKNHIFIVPEVLEQTREVHESAKGAKLLYSICRMKFTFYAEDGSHIEAVVVGEGMDSGDKATNKAMSVAYKYACFQVFCIPTEEMKDPDAESPELAPAEPQFKPASAEQLHKINEYVMAYAGMCENTKESDVIDVLKKKFGFESLSSISAHMANLVIAQVEAWYKKKKEVDG